MYYRIKQLTLLVVDLALLWIGFYLSLIIRYGKLPESQVNGLSPFMWPLFGVAAVILFVAGLYDIAKIRNNVSLYKKISISAGVWVILSVLVFYTNSATSVTPKTILLLNTLISFGLIMVWRFFYHSYIAKNFLTTTLIFAGLSKETKELIDLFEKQPEHGYRVLGVVDSGEKPAELNLPFGNTLDELLKNVAAPDIIVVSPSMAKSEILSELYRLLFLQVGVISLIDFYEDKFGRVPSFAFSESWFVTNLQEQRKKMYDRARIIADYLVALIMGIFFIATFPFVATVIKLTSKGPVLFKQARVGRGETPFTMYKYRTMKALTATGSAEINGPQFAAQNDARITAVGKFLRRTRFDELPQFINILKGEMGLIGPRPERPEFVTEITKRMPFYALRHLIKPGLTGWAQLQNSYYGNIEENLLKLQYDLYYVKNRSLALDIAIVLRTINILFRMIGR